MKLVRLVSASLFASVSAVVLVGLSGCGGFNTEDAEARCEQEEEARGEGSCFNAVAFEGCVAAFEECGDDVVINDACPLTFTCPE